MKNPFHYGGVVTGNDFCNRTEEQQVLFRAIQNSEKLFIYSERRIGKTSLVKQVLQQAEKKGSTASYIDLWPTDSEASFITTVAKSITMSMGGTAQKLLSTAKQFFGKLAPSVSLNDEGKPVVTFRVQAESQITPLLEDVLSVPVRLSKKNRSVVIVFDEFQRIVEYDSDTIEGYLRSIIQQQKDVCYLFLGSRKHIIKRLFLDSSRPLYRSSGHFPLGPIDMKEWVPFIRHKFELSGKSIEPSMIHDLCNLTGGHPFYTQHICHVLWELGEPNQSLKANALEKAINILLNRESYAYTMLWESLTSNQQRFLRGLSVKPSEMRPFSSEFLKSCGIKSSSSAQRAAEALIEKDLIDRENGGLVIVDRFFKIWIAEKFK